MSPTNYHLGRSGLFKTAGFAGRQLHRNEIDLSFRLIDFCSVDCFNILGLGAKVTTHDSEGFLGNLVFSYQFLLLHKFPVI